MLLVLTTAVRLRLRVLLMMKDMIGICLCVLLRTCRFGTDVRALCRRLLSVCLRVLTVVVLSVLRQLIVVVSLVKLVTPGAFVLK